MNRIRTQISGLGVLVLIACLGCAAGSQGVEPSTEPTAAAAAAAAAEPADDSGDSGGSADDGAAFYAANGCASCHGTTGGGGFQGPAIRGGTAANLLSFMDGSAMHGGGTVKGVTAKDAEDMEAFLKKLRAELEAALKADERVQIK